MSAVSSTTTSSRRGYLSVSELNQFIDGSLADNDTIQDLISQAEEYIDSYAGFQDKFYKSTLTALAASGGASTLTLNSDHQNTYNQDYFKGCEVEIIGGTGAGQRRTISGSTKAGLVTVQDAWTTAPDSTSFYKIYQLGKFPRSQDVHFDGISGADRYYKSIPEAVKRATAAQYEYMTEMGESFFETDQSEKQSESIGDYSYSNAQGANGKNKLIAPKAKIYLRGIRNITGTIIV